MIPDNVDLSEQFFQKLVANLNFYIERMESKDWDLTLSDQYPRYKKCRDDIINVLNQKYDTVQLRREINLIQEEFDKSL